MEFEQVAGRIDGSQQLTTAKDELKEESKSTTTTTDESKSTATTTDESKSTATTTDESKSTATSTDESKSTATSTDEWKSTVTKIVLVLLPIVTVVVLAIIVHHVYRLSQVQKWGKEVTDHAPGPCRIIEGIEFGSEGIELLKDRRTAFITSGYNFDNPTTKTDGQIFRFDLGSPDIAPVLMKIEGPLAEKPMTLFNPQGISSWEDAPTGEVTLFVVNHALDKTTDVIEKFSYDRNRDVLVHVGSIEDDAFRYTNDLVMTGPDSFYIANDFHSLSPTGRQMEMLFLLEWGSIVYYDGSAGTVVARGIAGANAIAISPDGRWVYQAEFNNLALATFERKPDNSLTLTQTTYVDTSIDNLSVDSSGDLWAGCHPIQHKLGPHLADPTANASPSQVLRLRTSDGRVTDVEEIFMESKGEISGSSSAVYDEGSLLIGTLFHKLMYCEVVQQSDDVPHVVQDDTQETAQQNKPKVDQNVVDTQDAVQQSQVRSQSKTS